MKECTTPEETKIFQHGNRLIYVQRKWVAIVCLSCGGAIALHTFVPQTEVRFPFFKQCPCEK